MSDRKNVILDIIRENKIETQEELAEELRRRGIEATQATVSRDIKALGLIKTPQSGGRYCYAPPETHAADNLMSIFEQSVVSAAAAQNIVALKTYPAMASGACYLLDSRRDLGIVGTIAGDDTAFILMKTRDDALSLAQKINERTLGVER